MADSSKEDRKGWAGQWDRHRWKVKVVNPSRSSSPEPEHRLRSLDEFKPLPWHSRPHSPAARKRGPAFHISGAEAWTIGLACVFVGVAAWTST
jgi:hypothetical protein